MKTVYAVVLDQNSWYGSETVVFITDNILEANDYIEKKSSGEHSAGQCGTYRIDSYINGANPEMGTTHQWNYQ